MNGIYQSRSMNEHPVDWCQMCGADLFLDVPHECPVGGNVVTVTEQEDR